MKISMELYLTFCRGSYHVNKKICSGFYLAKTTTFKICKHYLK